MAFIKRWRMQDVLVKRWQGRWVRPPSADDKSHAHAYATSRPERRYWVGRRQTVMSGSLRRRER